MQKPTPARAARPTRRPWSASKVLDLVVAAVAHVAVMGAWAVTLLAVMGAASIGRQLVMNSEFAFDTGRLPQPWVIPLGIVAIVVAHLFFGWSMRRYARGPAAYGPAALAWAGAWAGIVVGAYVWYPPVEVGRQVGPRSGQSTPWGPLAWFAYYARPALPALMTLFTAVVWLTSRHSPVVVAWRAIRRAFANRGGRRRAAAA